MSEFLQSPHLWGPGLLAMLGLALGSAFFSGSETALFYLSHDELRGFRSGNRRERMAAALLADADRLLTAVLFWNLVINLTYFAVSVVVAHRLIRAGQPTAAGIYGIASLIGIIVLGEVVPKSLAVVLRRPVATWVSWPLAAAVRLLDPILPPLQFITRLARRAFWPQIVREPHLDADDLERAVELSAASAEVIRQEREVLHNILDLSEITVEEVMRPRGTYLAKAPPLHLADLQGSLPPGDYLLVCAPDSEHIEAAVPLADFVEIPERNLEEAAEPVVHVPWCANLADTLTLMREQFAGVASVVNEYGETIGIVTFEDIMETILVPQASRAKRILQREPILEIAPGRFHVEGLTTLRHLCKRFGLEYEPDEDSHVTVSGMLNEQLERFPVVGDECHWRGYRFRVFDVTRHGQIRVVVERDPATVP